MLNYDQMEQRWGSVVAMHVIREIEKAAKLSSNENMLPQTRLERALRVQEGR